VPDAIRRPRGRPRDRSIDKRILEATLSVVAERGIGGAAMDEIALRSGVSKATIYQRWPSKEALCVDAVRQSEPEITETAGADPRADCVALLSELSGQRASERSALLLPRILAEASGNAELARVFQERIILPRRAQCAHIVERAIDRHQLARNTDVQFAVDMLIGPIFYRRLIRNAGSLDPAFPASLVNAVWTAFGT
jgi:AcrR family transcriptional regulator